jgi:hypothetical protein
MGQNCTTSQSQAITFLQLDPVTNWLLGIPDLDPIEIVWTIEIQKKCLEY